MTDHNLVSRNIVQFIVNKYHMCVVVDILGYFNIADIAASIKGSVNYE